MEKINHWYSIIQYSPNSLRGEVLNVGLLLHNPLNGELKYYLLDSANTKLKSLLANDVLNSTYRVQRDYIDYFIKQIPKERSLLSPDNFTNSFLEDLNSKLPEGFRLSEPTFSKVKDVDQIFSSLLDLYIGKEFLTAFDHASSINTKRYVKKLFDDRKLIDTKIKSNVKISPIKEVSSMFFTIDFVYKNGVINLLQAVPSSKDRLNDWFTKMNTILNVYQNDSGFYVLNDPNDTVNDDNTLSDMINYLSSKDKRIKNINVQSKEFEVLCNKIETEGKNVDEFESDLAAV